MKFLLSIGFLFLFLQGICQDSAVVVHKDPRLDLLVSKQIEINETSIKNARRSGPGFRIMVINTNNRNKAQEIKSQVYRQFPELKAYLQYQTPFYRLKVGNFLDRAEADEYLENIRRIFGKDVYVVRDIVEIRPGN